jgi:regulator of cell morphogenesis and NO signaling
MNKFVASSEDTQMLMQRYSLMRAQNLVYTYEELKELGIQPDFLLAMLEVFENPATFSKEKFDAFKLTVIIDYLKKTHAYYLHKKLLEIEQSIHLLAAAYPVAHPLLLLLDKFYLDYKTHLIHHIRVEENDLLPYIISLENKSVTEKPALTVQGFIDQHHDTEKDLADVRKAMQHYSPPAGNETIYRILVSQLEVLEKDLAVHALMEDEVLLPRALALEKHS